MKTLEEAIGCWTCDGMLYRANLVRQSVRISRALTRKNKVAELREELKLLQKRIDAMKELTDSALARLNEITTTDELTRL